MRRMRRSTKRRIVFGCVCVAVQVCLLWGYREGVSYVTAQRYEALLEEQEQQMLSAGRTVYITTDEVKAGAYFTEENTEKRYLLSEQNPDGLAQKVIGTVACADIAEGMIVTTALCYEKQVASSERECVFDCIEYAECFVENAVVDVRIRFDNGENYCVLKKKRLYKQQEEKEVCRFFLTEEEQLLMSAALYDTEMYEGARLYVVGFREERLQTEEGSSYPPCVQIIAQLREWKGDYAGRYSEWCRQRMALEERLLEHKRQCREGLL